MWEAVLLPKREPKLDKPILIEGLPGIGNVGKVAVDFLIDEIKAKPLFEFVSYRLPNSVFVNEDNIVELPRLEVYYKQRKGARDLLFLVGDVQPIDEESCYDFCDVVLDLLDRYKGTDVITTGGIGLQAIPEQPKLYITGSDKDIVEKYKKGIKCEPSLYGVVGPIVGVSGVLLGLAGRREGMAGVAMLAETFGHPMYLGLKGAKVITQALSKKLRIKANLKKMDKEIAELEKESLQKTKDMQKVQKSGKKRSLQKLRDQFGGQTNYIG